MWDLKKIARVAYLLFIISYGLGILYLLIAKPEVISQSRSFASIIGAVIMAIFEALYTIGFKKLRGG